MRPAVGLRSGAMALTYDDRSKDVWSVVLPGGMVPVVEEASLEVAHSPPNWENARVYLANC